MPRQARLDGPGTPHHVTLRGTRADRGRWQGRRERPRAARGLHVGDCESGRESGATISPLSQQRPALQHSARGLRTPRRSCALPLASRLSALDSAVHSAFRIPHLVALPAFQPASPTPVGKWSCSTFRTFRATSPPTTSPLTSPKGRVESGDLKVGRAYLFPPIREEGRVTGGTGPGVAERRLSHPARHQRWPARTVIRGTQRWDPSKLFPSVSS